MTQQEKVNYIEFAAVDLEKTKKFFTDAFGWTFVDYGPEYSSFEKTSAGIDGGFYKADLVSTTENGGALVVLLSDDLESSLQKVESAGGRIVKPIFSFPGGRRFQFCEPSGNELAVWSKE